MRLERSRLSMQHTHGIDIDIGLLGRTTLQEGDLFLTGSEVSFGAIEELLLGQHSLSSPRSRFYNIIIQAIEPVFKHFRLMTVLARQIKKILFSNAQNYSYSADPANMQFSLVPGLSPCSYLLIPYYSVAVHEALHLNPRDIATTGRELNQYATTYNQQRACTENRAHTHKRTHNLVHNHLLVCTRMLCIQGWEYCQYFTHYACEIYSYIVKF